MLIRKLIVLLALAPTWTWAFASGQIVCNQVGNQTICNGAGGPQQYNFPEQMAAMQQAQAAQQSAGASCAAANWRSIFRNLAGLPLHASRLPDQCQRRIPVRPKTDEAARDGPIS
jgi:hypothetical protein